MKCNWHKSYCKQRDNDHEADSEMPDNWRLSCQQFEIIRINTVNR